MYFIVIIVHRITILCVSHHLLNADGIVSGLEKKSGHVKFQGCTSMLELEISCREEGDKLSLGGIIMSVPVC